MSNDRFNETRPVDALISRERIRGASRMIAEGTEASAVTEDQIAVVISDVDTHIKAYKIGRKQLAAQTGYGHATISEFLCGKYKGNRAQVAIELQEWLVSDEQRRQRPAVTQYVETECVHRIKSTATFCLDYGKMGLIYGPDTSGIGKTTALRAIQQELGHRRGALVTIDKVDSSPTRVIRKIAEALHIDRNGSNALRFDLIVNHLRGRNFLLMIDQIHNLRGAKDDKPLYILADLYDATKCGQLWCGTADMVAYLNRQRQKVGDESLAQIRRRLFPCVDLMEGIRTDGAGGEPIATIEQVREIFAKNKMKLTRDATKFLCARINDPDSGGIGLAEQLVEYANVIAEFQGKREIDVALLRAALAHGVTRDRARVIMHEDDFQAVPERAAKAG